MSKLFLGIGLLLMVEATMFSSVWAMDEQQPDLNDVAESSRLKVKPSDIAKLIP